MMKRERICEAVRAVAPAYAGITERNLVVALELVAARLWVICYPENEHTRVIRAALLEAQTTGFIAEETI